MSTKIENSILQSAHTIIMDMSKTDLEQYICNGCGCVKPEFSGVWWQISHSCNANKTIYRPGSFTLRHLKNAISGIDPLECFKGLFDFASFNPMKNFDTATELEKKWFRYQRESDIKTMLRLRKYMQLEDEFESKF